MLDPGGGPGAAVVFPTLRCFAAVGGSFLTSIARVAQRHYFPAGKENGVLLLTEGSPENDYLWVLEEGSVAVEERGEVLGNLEVGNPLALSVVLGRTERQPFTVRSKQESHLSVWCIPTAVVNTALRQSPESKQALEEVLEKQFRRLLVQRVARTVFFSHCCKHFMQPLQGQMKVEFYRRNCALFSEGDPSDSMMVIASGSCQFRKNPMFQNQHHRARRALDTAAYSRMLAELATLRDNYAGKFDRAEVAREPSSRTPGGLVAVSEVESERTSSSSRSNSRSSSSSDENSSSSKPQSDEHPVRFKLPESKVCLDPSACRITTTAGPCAVVMGDGAVLGFEDFRQFTAVASSDCVVFVVSKRLFDTALKLHPAETRHFGQMSAARYQEAQHCGLRSLPEIQVLCQCSSAFLSALAEVAQPHLYFPGEAVPADGDLQGLVLLMAGVAEQEGDDGAEKKVNGPHSIGELQLLGAKVPPERLRASSLCQALHLSREDILECLRHYPNESTSMVQQVLRQNARKPSLRGGEELPGSPAEDAESSAVLNMWHLPFCEGLSPDFVEAFTMRLELVKVIPGQSLFRDGLDAELLAVLVKGRMLVQSSFAEDTELKVPFMVCGRNRNMSVKAVAVELCDLHRLSIASSDTLAKQFPVEMTQLLQRAMTFQARVHAELGYPWWTPCAVLRYQDVFMESQEDFLCRVAEQTALEIYMPGDELVRQGQRVDSTMIIETGEAEVQKLDHRAAVTPSLSVVAEVQDGFWIGGVPSICGFTGELKRNATIRATKVCKVHRLPNSTFVELLADFPQERQRFRHLAERQMQTRGEVESLEEYDFFRGLSRDLLNLLRPRCRPLVFFANEAIMKQGRLADSLVILGAQADVFILADGIQVQEHKGRACLGVAALLTKPPVRRASTVVTRIACCVRSLSRSDWLDALSHYPEHRRWMDSFKAEQLDKVSKARDEFTRRRAWEKIRNRETGATQMHCDRIGSSTPQPSRARTRCSGRPSRASTTTPRPARGFGESFSGRDSTFGPVETWDCFNGHQVVVPHTRLPRLGGAVKPDEGTDSPEPASAEADGTPVQPGKPRRRTLDVWQASGLAIRDLPS